MPSKGYSAWRFWNGKGKGDFGERLTEKKGTA